MPTEVPDWQAQVWNSIPAEPNIVDPSPLKDELIPILRHRNVVSLRREGERGGERDEACISSGSG